MEVTANSPSVLMLVFTDSAQVQTLAIATAPVTMVPLVLILFAHPDVLTEELAFPLETAAVPLDGTELTVPIQSV